MDSLVNFSPLVVVAWKRGAGSRAVLAERKLEARTSVAKRSGTLEGRVRVRMPGMYHRLRLIWLRSRAGTEEELQSGRPKGRPLHKGYADLARCFWAACIWAWMAFICSRAWA